MKIEPIFITIVTISTCSLTLALPTLNKRQGFFACSGWGAGCSSSWYVPRRAHNMPQPRIPSQPSLAARQFWLTSGMYFILCLFVSVLNNRYQEVQVGNDPEKAQSEKRFPLQKPRREKTKLPIRYLYHENIS